MRVLPLVVVIGIVVIALLVAWYLDGKDKPMSTTELLELQGTYLERAAQADQFGTAIEADGWRNAAESVAEEIRKR